MTKTVMIIGLDWHPDSDGRQAGVLGPEGVRGWRRQPFADGGRLHLDRTRAEDWDNLFYELGELARVDSIAFGLRGVFQEGAMASLPIARAAWNRVTWHRPSVTAWCDTVGLGDIVNVPGSGEFKFDCANGQHIQWAWDRYLKPFFDAFADADLTRSANGKVLIAWWSLAPNTGHGIRNQHHAQRLLDYIDQKCFTLGLGGADHIVDKTWIELCPDLRVYGAHNWFDGWSVPPQPYSMRTHNGVTVGVAVPSFFDRINPDGNADTITQALAAMRVHVPPVDVVLLESGTNFSEAAEFMRDETGSTAKLDAVRRFVLGTSVSPPIHEDDVMASATFCLRRSERIPHPTLPGYFLSPYPGGGRVSIQENGDVQSRPDGTDGPFESWREDGNRSVFDRVFGWTYALPLVD